MAHEDLVLTEIDIAKDLLRHKNTFLTRQVNRLEFSLEQSKKATSLWKDEYFALYNKIKALTLLVEDEQAGQLNLTKTSFDSAGNQLPDMALAICDLGEQHCE
jgi:hypothetical protein